MTSDASGRLLPEQCARVRIDAMLEAAGWVVQGYKAVNLYAATGVAVQELVTNAGPADYERFHRFSYDELVARDKASLDIFWLRDESLEDTDNLPAPGVMAAEIVEDLQAALAEFTELAESLQGIGVEIEGADG